ncbi:MAG: SHOCT domain-containing protein, partial [Desulfobacteraceae bacterium]
CLEVDDHHMRAKTQNKSGLFKAIMMSHVVLVLHLLLFAGIGLVVAFVGGVMQYMIWILLAGMLSVALSAYLIYRRMRREGKSIADTLRSPMFRGRSVEVSLLGGFATMRLESGKPDPAIEESSQAPMQLEDPETARIREINSLAQLLEKKLITPDEFDMAKQRLLRP